MGCSSAAAACTRLASCPAGPVPAVRTAPARPPAPAALAPASPAAAHSRDGVAMLPGLIHLRVGSAGCCGAAGLRTAVRTCSLGRGSSGRASFGEVPSTCVATTSTCSLTPLRRMWSRSCRPTIAAAAAAPTAALTARTASAATAAAAAPLDSASAPFAAFATAAPQAQRHRGVATYARAAGATGAAGGKKPKAPQAQAQAQTQTQVKQAAALPASNAAAPAAQAAPLQVRYSPLHHNIEEFCSRVVLTEGERRQRMEVIEGVRAGVRRVWPSGRGVDVQVFGSFANGLSTWNSDIDLVVTGVCEPDRISGGYDPSDRARITSKLRKLSEALNRANQIDIERQQFIPRARIPILKLWTRRNVCVDVSVSDDSGPRAARYMVQQCRAYPPLKPLVLVLKAYLKYKRLNEVNTGGLSSYSLTNMVIAHLQEELKAGQDISDLGETLYTFFLRYGEEFDYGTQAVSVSSGGVVPKSSLGFAMESARQAAASMGSYAGAVSWQHRLCVDCPLTGRDVSSGSYRIDLVRSAFHSAADNLRAMAKGRRISDTSINYLNALFNVSQVLKRGQGGGVEPYEDDFVRVVGGRGAHGDAGFGDEEEGEDLPLGVGSGPDEDEDDIGGDYLRR